MNVRTLPKWGPSETWGGIRRARGVGIAFEPCREVGGLGGDGGGIGDLVRGLGVGSGVVLRGWEASVERGREG